MTTRTARTVRWLVEHIPTPILDSPERVFLNFACIVIGIGGLFGAEPGSLLAFWPRWVAYEWSVGMVVGGTCALIGYWNGKRPLARLGYLLIAITSLIFATTSAVVFGWDGLRVAAIFFGMALAKTVRLLVGSAIRNEILSHAQDKGRP